MNTIIDSSSGNLAKTTESLDKTEEKVRKPVIAIFSDNPFGFSGVGCQVRHICKELLKNNFEVVVLAVCNPEPGSPPNLKYHTPEGDIKVRMTDKFSNITILMNLIQEEKPDCLVLFQDPHYYYPLLQHIPAIRKDIPIVFIHVWDTDLLPHLNGPPHWNLNYYENVDSIGAISRQTYDFVDKVLSKQKNGSKPLLTWVGHGRDPDIFKPTPINQKFKKVILRGKKAEFIVLVNNKNQSRKHIPDTIEAFRLFTESLSKEKADSTALILHTQVAKNNRSNMVCDINIIVKSLAPECNIIVEQTPYSEPQLNELYNLSDVFVNAASSEGFGLTSHEASLAGVPLIINRTGGLKDQAGIDCNGEWCYMLKNHRTIIGTTGTPYLYDQIADIDDIANAFKYWYDIAKEERTRRGLLGRKWCLDQGLTSESFGTRVVNLIKTTIDNFNA